jgi:hypothetical protein
MISATYFVFSLIALILKEIWYPRPLMRMWPNTFEKIMATLPLLGGFGLMIGFIITIWERIHV